MWWVQELQTFFYPIIHFIRPFCDQVTNLTSIIANHFRLVMIMSRLECYHHIRLLKMCKRHRVRRCSRGWFERGLLWTFDRYVSLYIRVWTFVFWMYEAILLGSKNILSTISTDMPALFFFFLLWTFSNIPLPPFHRKKRFECYHHIRLVKFVCV